MILRRLFIICSVLFSECVLHAQNKETCHVSLVRETNESYIFSVTNSSNDTIYFFDRYLEKWSDGYLYSSKYVHLCDKKNKSFRLSLIPIFPSIRQKGCLNGRISNQKDKIIRVGQLAFSFKKIEPFDSIVFSMDKKAFCSLEYVKDYYPEHLSCYHHLLPKLKNVKVKKKPFEVKLCLAIYKEVSILNKWCKEIFEENISLKAYDEQATNFQILSVSVFP